MDFDGWPTTMIEFYSELEVNNTKDFWTANKATYDDEVRAPMEALTDALADEFGEAKIFRPYRDVRFSKDKTPYKTQIAAVHHTVGGAVGFYIRAGADGLGVGGGAYQMAKDQLERFRKAVDAPSTGEELVGIVAALRDGGYDIGGETLKTAPRGYPKDHPRIELLRHKGITFMREAEPGPIVHSAKAVEFARETFRAGTPLLSWIDANVGATTIERRR